MLYDEHLKDLKKAPWPLCDRLAAEIAQLPGAAETLAQAALKSKGHHARSAALRALSTVDRQKAAQVATSLLADPSYEVRMDAEAIVGAQKQGRSSYAKTTNTKKSVRKSEPRSRGRASS